jgi:hypothetical protein
MHKLVRENQVHKLIGKKLLHRPMYGMQDPTSHNKRLGRHRRGDRTIPPTRC